MGIDLRAYERHERYLAARCCICGDTSPLRFDPTSGTYTCMEPKHAIMKLRALGIWQDPPPGEPLLPGESETIITVKPGR